MDKKNSIYDEMYTSQGVSPYPIQLSGPRVTVRAPAW